MIDEKTDNLTTGMRRLIYVTFNVKLILRGSIRSLTIETEIKLFVVIKSMPRKSF